MPVKFVKIVHPEAGEGTVPASAVKHWESSGWSPADEAPKADKGPAGDSAGEAASKQRRTPKESD
jgi:hypothetical protein